MVNQLTYEEVPYRDVADDMNRMFMEGYKEMDHYDGMKPDVNHEMLSNLDNLQTIVAKDGDKVVGIHSTIISPDMFYQQINVAYVLFYYMSPMYRGRGRGLALFQYAEDQYKDKDVDRIFMSRKIYIQNEKLFEALEFTQIEANYTKAIT